MRQRGAFRSIDSANVFIGHLRERWEEAAREIGVLRQVCGPKMPCGCYAVECVPYGHVDQRPSVVCVRHGATQITPEYDAWREARRTR